MFANSLRLPLQFPVYACITLVLLIAGCSGLPATHNADDYPHAGDAMSHADTGLLIARTALDAMGTPYQFGGNTPEGFDCSGLVHYVHAVNGIAVPRTSKAQYKEALPVQDPEVGDLLFFRIGSKLSHVGIYLGDGRFVHAPSTGKQVSLARLDNPYYQKRLVRAGRLHD